MKNLKCFLHSAAATAALLTLAACSSEDILSAEDTTALEETTVVKGHPLTISAAIGTTPTTRMGSAEGDNGIKLTWDKDDPLYMLTSTDGGSSWADTYFTFKATEVKDNQATFVCDNFAFPEGTTKVKFVYTSTTPASKADLDKTKQSLGEQTGLITDVAKKLYMETEAMDATSEEAVKQLTATLNHANAVMKVVIPKSDIEWGDDGYAPRELTMKLQSSSLKLEGTTDNTITVKNDAAAWEGDQLVANVVVCMTGTKADGDRWIFTTKDGLGNTLTRATSSAKALTGGKRYNAPVTFETGDYFPLLASNWNWFSGTESDRSFDETTKTIINAEYGAGGWEFGSTTPLNLSKYEYLVVTSTAGYGKGNQLRLYNSGFWDSTCNETDINEAKAVFDLDNITKKNDESVRIDKSKIQLVCFWGLGGEDNKLVLDKIYLTNTKPEGNNPSATVDPITDANEDAFE